MTANRLTYMITEGQVTHDQFEKISTQDNQKVVTNTQNIVSDLTN